MAQDIVPVQLGLTQGDVVTLWAPRWREDGEEWEAFLGHGEHLYVFPDAAHLAAFVRTADEHDLTDHPVWNVVPELTVDELTPDETQRYDLVSVPEIVANDPDTWAIGELADVLVMVRSLADVCDLEKVNEILDSADGFVLVDQGAQAFIGREGERLWTEMATVVAEKWDDVLDAFDEVVTTPDVDAAALATAEAEVPEPATDDDEDEDVTDLDDDAAIDEEVDADDASDVTDGDEPDFWQRVGIDPIRITTTQGAFVTLRCYLDEKPVFLGESGTIEVFKSERALAKHVAAGENGATGHDLANVSTWDEVVTAATAGELRVVVDDMNSYNFVGLNEDLAEGPGSVDPTQLELAVELASDAAEWARDDSVAEALKPSESLGWLVSFVLRPDPTRLAPSAPYDAEVTSWQAISNGLMDRLHVN